VLLQPLADIVEAITYLNERNPTAAAKLDAEIARCIERLAAGEFARIRFASLLRRSRPQLGRATVSDLLPAES